MTPTELTYSNNLKIKFINEQMRENDWRGSTGSSFDKSWFYKMANESLEKRIALYK